MTEDMMQKFREQCLSYNARNSYVKYIVCDVLGYEKNHMYNQLIGELYDNHMKEDYLPVVYLETVISPMLENKLQGLTLEKRKEVAGEILDAYIKPISCNFRNGDVASAEYMFMYMNDWIRRFVQYEDTSDKVIKKTL